jgi:hypothetical protein
MLFSLTFVYLLKQNKRQTTDQPKYLTMANTKALTRGLFVCVLNRVHDSDGNLEIDFPLHARELQAPSERSISVKSA